MAEDAGGPGRLSLLLGQARSGNPEAFQAVFEAAYPELRALARARLRRQQPGGAGGLQTTALVHEAYLRFAGSAELQAEHRAHFFRYASRVMRSVIVDAIRERSAQRRGGGSPHDELDSQIAQLRDGGEEEVLKVHEALDGLAEYDPRLVDVVHMRYFGGMTDREIAQVLGVTERTVRRDWEKARLLLLEALEP
ncbi:MAG TPA: ECF-type sigma factor [Polyangiales bacterium]|nr:ECF-type sigma factor [Polyangiales bacterium]